MVEPILEVHDVIVEYAGAETDVRAVSEVSFDVAAGEFVAIVGESGCGKSTLLFAIAQLLNPPARMVAGEVIFQGRNMVHLDKGELRHSRWRDFSVVMQSAMNALNPMKSIGAQFKDTLKAHAKFSADEIRQRSTDVIRMVGIDATHLASYPHQLSGGMRQRAMIAMALLMDPQLVIMDEPTSALDVVAQRALMSQIKGLQDRLGFAVIFVTHDMSAVSEYSDRVMVMYAGAIMEAASTDLIFERPMHPYTRGLMDAFPSLHGPRRELTGIPGTPPDLRSLPPGCPFQPRCSAAFAECPTHHPDLYPVDGARVRCLLYDGQKKEAVC